MLLSDSDDEGNAASDDVTKISDEVTLEKIKPTVNGKSETTETQHSTEPEKGGTEKSDLDDNVIMLDDSPEHSEPKSPVAKGKCVALSLRLYVMQTFAL